MSLFFTSSSVQATENIENRVKVGLSGVSFGHEEASRLKGLKNLVLFG